MSSVVHTSAIGAVRLMVGDRVLWVRLGPKSKTYGSLSYFSILNILGSKLILYFVIFTIMFKLPTHEDCPILQKLRQLKGRYCNQCKHARLYVNSESSIHYLLVFHFISPYHIQYDYII